MSATEASAATRSSQPPTAAPFTAAAHESQPEAKQRAALVVHALTNYEPGDTADIVAERLIAHAGATAPPDPRLLAEVITPVIHHGYWSRGTVEYAQLGGLRPARTSVMVVVRQEIGTPDGFERSETRTMDVRLRRDGEGWVLDTIADIGGTPVPRPADLPPEAVSVLDDPRIELPDSAKWDIMRGHTTIGLLRVMAALAEETPYAAVVLASGHPYHVFATDRVSHHSVGQAIDIYRIGDNRVIDEHALGSRTRQVAEWLFARDDVAQVGAPWALDGAGGRSFTDEVHHDHLHVAARAS